MNNVDQIYYVSDIMLVQGLVLIMIALELFYKAKSFLAELSELYEFLKKNKIHKTNSAKKENFTLPDSTKDQQLNSDWQPSNSAQLLLPSRR